MPDHQGSSSILRTLQPNAVIATTVGHNYNNLYHTAITITAIAFAPQIKFRTQWKVTTMFSQLGTDASIHYQC